MLKRLEAAKEFNVKPAENNTTSILGDMLDFFDLCLIGYVLVFIVTQWKPTFIQPPSPAKAGWVGVFLICSL